MCGIAGVVREEPSSAVEAHALNRMAAALRHRGPDDEGFFSDHHAALAHTRLSIIDLSTGRQPLANEDETIWIVFNGEIYNFQELRKELEGKGHRFRTATDTEAIVHLYEEEGEHCLRKLRGMFALAIWDSRHRRLLLARDRLGKKPLVYTLFEDSLAFASELNALMTLPGISRELNPAALDQYLCYGYIPHPHTIYRNIFKLPPAHYAIFEDGKLEIRRYWSLGNEPPQVAVSEQEACEQVREEVTEATRLRLISDVPLGAFLSGGVDSSIIVALMQQLSSRPVKTFSIRFAESEYDESGHARQVANHLGTEHHEFLVEGKSFEALPDLIWHYGEPFADASALPTWFVAKLTRQAVTVAMTGDGGDEIFCGYDRYNVLQKVGRFDKLPRSIRRLTASPAFYGSKALGRKSTIGRRMRTFLELLALSPRKRISRIASVIFSERSRHALYQPEFAEQIGESDAAGFIHAAYDEFGTPDFLAHATLVDQVTYLPCDILTKVDIASMAHGLECRSPFLDHKVVELAASIPTSLKLRRGCAKYILKRAFADLIPKKIMTRRKQGFVVPIAGWFRGELKNYLQDVLLDPTTVSRGYFRRSAVGQLIEDHASGSHDHSRRLWALLCFELWHRQFVDAVVPQTICA